MLITNMMMLIATTIAQAAADGLLCRIHGSNHLDPFYKVLITTMMMMVMALSPSSTWWIVATTKAWFYFLLEFVYLFATFSFQTVISIAYCDLRPHDISQLRERGVPHLALGL